MERKSFFISDGHPAQRFAKVGELAESLKDKLELYYLSPCFPELNPDEWPWNDLEDNGVRRMPVGGPDDMRQEVVGRMKRMQQILDLIRSLFQALRQNMPPGSGHL